MSQGEVVWEAAGVGGGRLMEGRGAWVRASDVIVGAVEGHHGVLSWGETCSAPHVTVLSAAAVWRADRKAGGEAGLQVRLLAWARPAGEMERSRRR